MDDLTQTPELYHPDILAYARNPPQWRKEHNALYMIKAFNPVCGDKFEIRLDIDGIITDTSFYGYGCVVSKASTALLTEKLLNLHPEEAVRLVAEYIRTLSETKHALEKEHPLSAFLSVRAYPGRMQCVLLGWKSLLEHAPFKELSNKLP